jgi:predicted nucleic acid-binding Zn ribbon protein
MNCPNCGVYNPEDRTVCWRCAKELPKPVEPPKKKDSRKRYQIYLWIAIVILVTLMVLQFVLRPAVS